jgi:hypothetical protein
MNGPYLSQINSTPSFSTSLKSLLISHNPNLIVLPAGLFPSDFIISCCVHFPSSHSCYMSSHVFRLHFTTIVIHSKGWVKIMNVRFRSQQFPHSMLLHISKSPAQPNSSSTYSQNFENSRRLKQVSLIYWRREFPCVLYHKPLLTKLFFLRNKTDLWIVTGYDTTTSNFFYSAAILTSTF